MGLRIGKDEHSHGSATKRGRIALLLAHRRGRLRADRFPLPADLSLHALVAQAGTVTGRQAVLDLLEDMDPLGPSGRVDRYGSRSCDLDVVQAPADADPELQQHIVLHEVAHMVSGHVPIPDRGVDLSQMPLLAAHFGHDRIQEAFEFMGSHLRGCEACDPTAEAEAEGFARRLSVRIARARRPHARPGAGPADQELAERVDRAFGLE